MTKENEIALLKGELETLKAKMEYLDNEGLDIDPENGRLHGLVEDEYCALRTYVGAVERRLAYLGKDAVKNKKPETGSNGKKGQENPDTIDGKEKEFLDRVIDAIKGNFSDESLFPCGYHKGRFIVIG